MRNAWKRSLALLMTLVMLLCMLPAAASAEQGGDLPVAEDGAALIEEESALEATADTAANAGPRAVVASGECGSLGDNLSWALYDDGELVLSGIGAMAHAYSSPWYDYTQKIITATIEAGVTSIGAYAFSSCYYLTSITLPSGLVSIDDYAFRGCHRLTNPALPASLTSIGEAAFESCSALTSLVFPNGLVSIGEYSFSDCSSLSSITIPSSVTSIGKGAFAWCGSLTDIAVAPDNQAYTTTDGMLFTKDGTELLRCNAGLSGRYIVPASVTSIGDYAFNRCRSLTSVELPAGLTRIGAWGFFDCDSLTGISIPSSVTNIDEWAFNDCRNLTDISADPGNCFYASIDGVLFNKEKTTLLYFPGGRSGSYSAPSGTEIIGLGAFSGCTGLTSVTIPEGVTSIEGWAFDQCRNLANITIADSVTSIGFDSFGGCVSLTSIALPANLTSIIGETFSDCSSLMYLAFPEGVTSIEGGAFRNCDSLTDVYFGGSEVLRNEREGTVWDTDSNEPLFMAVWHYGESILPPIPPPSDPATVSSGTCGDNLTWTLDDTGTLTISGTGDMWDFYYADAPWKSNAESIQNVILSADLTRIGNYAFFNCTNLTNINIPVGVTSIGDSAFYNCYGITFLEIPAGVTSIGDDSFSFCYGLTNIILPESLTSIGFQAFFYCVSLTSIMIPAEVTSIASPAFVCCYSLTSITVAAENPAYKSVDGVLFTKDGTELLTFPGGKSGEYVVPTGVTKIGYGAFEACAELTYITLPESVKSIDTAAFSGCSSLTSIALPAEVTSIAHGAFGDCESLINITVAGENSSYKSIDGVLFSEDNTELHTFPGGRCGAYIVPTGVRTIGEHAFCYCNLTSIKLPAGVTSIGKYTFLCCVNLDSITLPAGLTNIGWQAFSYCDSLTSISIPESVTTIDVFAFYGSESLSDVYFSGTEQQRNERKNNGWATNGNEFLFDAVWHYGGALPDFDGVLPAGLRTVEEEALAGTAFRAVRIPDGAEAIGAKAFAGSPDLEYVYIPESVTAIAEDAFDQVTGLTVIGRLGSAAEAFANAHGFAFLPG